MKSETIIPVVVAGIMRYEHILLLKRQKKPFRGMWSLPGGKIALNEFVNDAVKREVFEETKLELTSIEFLGVVSELLRENKRIIKGHLINVFLAKVNTSQVIDSNEGPLKWFTRDEIEENKKQIIPTDLLIILKMVYPNKTGLYISLVEKRVHGYTTEMFDEIGLS